MNLLSWIVIGVLVGGVASLLLGPHRRQSRPLNLGVGALGAGLAGWLLSPLVGLPAVNEGRFSAGALVVAAVGAAVALLLVNVVRRGDTDTATGDGREQGER